MKLKTVFRTAVLGMASLCVFGGWAFVSAAGSREIPFSALDGVRVGNAQDDAGLTGVTVLCFPDGAKTGVDIRGGGPASRETPVLDPTKEDIGIHAIVLSGGSAYGLAAYARAIKPGGTLADGDSVYAASCGTPVAADVNMVGTLAAEVMAKAIEDAIVSSKMEDAEYLSHCLTLPAR